MKFTDMVDGDTGDVFDFDDSAAADVWDDADGIPMDDSPDFVDSVDYAPADDSPAPETTTYPAGQGLDIDVDLTLMIDATGSMGPFIGNVKKMALSFQDELIKRLGSRGRLIRNFRIKVISYRDFFYNDAPALEESPWFSFASASERAALQQWVNNISPLLGGDAPEHGLEALAVAMQQDWCHAVPKNRNIIMVFTDAPCHKLEDSGSRTTYGYPSGMPRDFDEIDQWWNDPQSGKMNTSAKRLILFAPDDYPWTDISNEWENVVFIPSRAGKGCDEADMETVMSTLAGSI